MKRLPQEIEVMKCLILRRIASLLYCFIASVVQLCVLPFPHTMMTFEADEVAIDHVKTKFACSFQTLILNLRQIYPNKIIQFLLYMGR
jgi:hypothetical protein